MKHDILAPWAQPVPDAPYPLTATYLLTVPDAGSGLWEGHLNDEHRLLHERRNGIQVS